MPVWWTAAANFQKPGSRHLCEWIISEMSQFHVSTGLSHRRSPSSRKETDIEQISNHVGPYFSTFGFVNLLLRSETTELKNYENRAYSFLNHSEYFIDHVWDSNALCHLSIPRKTSTISLLISPLRWRTGSRTITSDRTHIYNNSSLSFPFGTRPYDIVG